MKDILILVLVGLILWVIIATPSLNRGETLQTRVCCEDM